MRGKFKNKKSVANQLRLALRLARLKRGLGEAQFLWGWYEEYKEPRSPKISLLLVEGAAGFLYSVGMSALVSFNNG